MFLILIISSQQPQYAISARKTVRNISENIYAAIFDFNHNFLKKKSILFLI